MKRILFAKLILLSSIATCLNAQNQNYETDSLYIDVIENHKSPDKVLHAEPLYIDLIRDLGARRGEKEWNIGLGLTDNLTFDSYEALIEYEWAPINRLGFEIELPFTFYSSNSGLPQNSIPKNKLNSLKVATQWSFFVNEKISTSLAFGYINEFLLADFDELKNSLIVGNVYNPFFIAAKRWGNNFHSLIYTGPSFLQDYITNSIETNFEINSNFHYMIPGTRNFVGFEFNKEVDHTKFNLTIRPQMRLCIAENLIVGIVVGIPIDKNGERLSSFVRLIWEPKHH